MDEIALLVEGIENKVKKLTVLNKQLTDKNESLEADKRELQGELTGAQQRIAKLEKEMVHLEVAGSLGAGETSRAKQKINELLREIEKTTVLLNR